MPKILKVGNWIDLCVAEDVKLQCPKACKLHRRKDKDKETIQEERIRDVIFDWTIAPLGVCIQVPKGYECIVAPRSSTFKKFGILQVNSIGVIDNLYAGDEDEWKMPMVATKAVVIPKGTRVAQFRVQPSQMATPWQKLKWLFGYRPKLVKVSTLSSNNRGGFGSTNNN